MESPLPINTTNLSPTTELYEAMEKAYSHFNEELFKGELPPVVFTVQRSGSSILGYFASNRWNSVDGKKAHEISINPVHVAKSCQMKVLSVLVHEMAHAWQQCFGKPSRGGYHNKQWAYKMSEIGLMPSNTSQPGGDITGEQMSHYIIQDGAFYKSYQNLVSKKGYEWYWMDSLAWPLPSEITIAKVKDPDLLIRKPKTTPVETLNWSDFEESPFTSFVGENVIRDWQSDIQKNKVTYHCEECNTKVWGKPDLNIVCGECDSQMFSLS
jgi:predicted SprT family Zn-dependent metalloprotease